MSARLLRLRIITLLNLRFAFASLCLMLAIYLWPETQYGWRWGIGSILLGLTGLSEFINALRKTGAFIIREREIAKMAEMGGPAKGDSLVSTDSLRLKDIVK